MKAIRYQIARLEAERNDAEVRLQQLHIADPHAALGVTGRRIQKRIEQCRDQLAALRDRLVLARLTGVPA